MDYKEAGVDIDKGNAVVENLKPLAKSTFRPGVLTDIGSFSGLFKLDKVKYKHPILVSGTDGVGTKLKYAFKFNKHDTIGIDLVAMCVNDVICCGAEPLFFLDYFATGKLDTNIHYEVIKGIAKGCKMAECSLIGGETAELPGFYTENEYDLAGFAVGVVEEKEIIDGKTIDKGDSVIAIASSGLHSNGYSLVRKIIPEEDYNKYFEEFGKTLAEEVLTPTTIYTQAVKVIKKYKINIKGMAHITGGGLIENPPRIMPKGLKFVLDNESIKLNNIFKYLYGKVSLTKKDALTTFNNGVGFIVVVSPEEETKTINVLTSRGHTAYKIGSVEPE